MQPLSTQLLELVKASINRLDHPVVAIVVVTLGAFMVIAWVSSGPR